MHRNRIIRMELNITMAGCAIAMTTAVAGLFGMNVPIPLGLDRDAGAFALVSGASLLLGAGAFGVAYGAVHQGWWGAAPHRRHPRAPLPARGHVRDRVHARVALASRARRGGSRPARRRAPVAAQRARDALEFKQLLASETGAT